MRNSCLTIRFVRALLKFKTAVRSEDGDTYVVNGKRPVLLETQKVASLVSEGVIKMRGDNLVPSPETHAWVKRQLSIGDAPFAQQHQRLETDVANQVVNTTESPLARLVSGNAAFLQPHQLAAAERFRKLFERAALRQHVTMSYDPGRVAQGGSTKSAGADLPSMSYDARCQIDRIINALPTDCVAVIMDVCGFEKGLQQVETERRWPRRSAKLVLRIGLEQLAIHFGLLPEAAGQPRNGLSIWRPQGARPMALRTQE